MFDRDRDSSRFDVEEGFSLRGSHVVLSFSCCKNVITPLLGVLSRSRGETRSALVRSISLLPFSRIL